MTITSYSQNFEDVLLWRALGHVKDGFYFDIGAMSPDHDSVTRLFYESGWGGINVDPIPENIREFRQKRPRDINVECAVSDTSGEKVFYTIMNSGLSTFELEFADDAERRGYQTSAQKVRTTTLESLWDEHVPADQEVHFLKIDVEGHEYQVIKGGNWKRHQPWVIVVEATKPNTQEENYQDWEQVLLEEGYLFSWFDGLNRYYVAKEHRELTSSLSVQPNYFDFFTLAEVVSLRGLLETTRGELDTTRGELDTTRGELLEKLRVLGLVFERRKKAVWEKAFFRQGGLPRALTRKIVVDKFGVVRPLLLKFVVDTDGVVKSPFFSWFKAEYIKFVRPD